MEKKYKTWRKNIEKSQNIQNMAKNIKSRKKQRHHRIFSLYRCLPAASISKIDTDQVPTKTFMKCNCMLYLCSYGPSIF